MNPNAPNPDPSPARVPSAPAPSADPAPPITSPPRRRPKPARAFDLAIHLTTGLAILIACTALASLASPWRVYPLDLLAMAAWMLTWPTLLLAACLALLRRPILAASLALPAAATLILHLANHARSPGPQPRIQNPAPLRLIAFNAFRRQSTGHDPFAQWTLQHQPDALCLTEGPLLLDHQTQQFNAAFPNRVGRGTRIPLYTSHTARLNRLRPGPKPPMPGMVPLRMTLADGRPVLIVAVHLSSPRSNQLWQTRLDAAEENAQHIRQFWLQTRIPVVVLGDFNSTPDGLIYQRFLNATGFREAKPGTFNQGAWPASMPRWASLAIDRCLVSPDVRIENVQLGPRLGSDHRPLLVDLQIPDARN